MKQFKALPPEKELDWYTPTDNESKAAINLSYSIGCITPEVRADLHKDDRKESVSSRIAAYLNIHS